MIDGIHKPANPAAEYLVSVIKKGYPKSFVIQEQNNEKTMQETVYLNELLISKTTIKT